MATVQDRPGDAAPVTSPFGVPIFRAVWLASLASNLGTMIQSVGASWTMVTLTGSPQLVALVSVSVTLPVFVLALAAGAVADSLGRRQVLIAAQAFMCLASTALTLCALAGMLTPWLLLGFTFLIGCGTALNAPAWQASVGEMVPRPLLPTAVAYNSMQFNAARTVGPAIGGVLVQAVGATAAFAVNAVTYLGLLGVLLRWHPDTPPATLPREPVRSAMAAGLRYVLMSPHLSVVLVRTALFGTGAGAVTALLPVVARQNVGGDAATYGVLLGAFGIGGVVAALLVGRVRRALSGEAIARVAWVCLAAATIVTGLSGALWLTVPALTLAGVSWLFAMSTFNSSTQLAAPRWVVARAVSIYQMSAFGGVAAGSLAFGWVAEHHGASVALLSAAAWQVVGGLLGLRFALPRVDALNLDPMRDWSEPRIAVPLESRSGPIVVAIDYRIAAEDIPAFLATMRERRRIRRRDGAYGWTLLRDLGDPELWTERYHVATWVDYVRHNQRRTQADAANLARILALHRGEGGELRVRRMLEQDPGGARGGDVPPAATTTLPDTG